MNNSSHQDLFVNPMKCPECGERQKYSSIYDFLPHDRMFQVCERCWTEQHDGCCTKGEI